MQDGCSRYFQDREKNVAELAMANLGINKISVFTLEMSKLLKTISLFPLFHLPVFSGKLIPLENVCLKRKIPSLVLTWSSGWRLCCVLTLIGLPLIAKAIV